MQRSFLLRLLTAAMWIGASEMSSAFLVATPSNTRPTPGLLARKQDKQQQDDSFLLQEFRMHTGEVVNPYAVLKIPRTADISQIKTAYRALSR